MGARRSLSELEGKLLTVSDFQAQKRLKSFRSSLSVAGWNLLAKGGDSVSRIDNLDGPAFYLCDLGTGQLHVIVTVKNLFQIIEKQPPESLSFQEVCDIFGSLYGDICDGKVTLDCEMSNVLAMAAAMYVRGTQGYRVALAEGRTHLNFVIFRHWDYSGQCNLLRPVPVPSRKLLQPEDVERIVNLVIATDREHHPERFRSATILQFKVNKRKNLSLD